MKEGLIKDAYELIFKEIQTIITILYLLMIGVGMLFNYKKYIKFEINIFDYADVFDFLIAPFQDVQIIMVSVLVLLLPLAIFWLDFYFAKRFPKSYSKLNFGMVKKPWFNKLKFVFFSFIILYVISEAATGYGNYMKNYIHLSQTVSVKFADDELMDGKMIGKTKEVIFLYTAGKVKIVPITSLVKEIELK